jgi:hypothetical protein
MNTEKIKITKMYEHYTSQETAKIFYMVENLPSQNILTQQINKFKIGAGWINSDSNNFENIFDDYYHNCRCQYDCCGHWNTSGIDFISYDKIYKFGIVQITYSQNV